MRAVTLQLHMLGPDRFGFCLTAFNSNPTGMGEHYDQAPVWKLDPNKHLSSTVLAAMTCAKEDRL